MDDLRRMLESLEINIEKKLERHKLPVGVVSEELRKKYVEWKIDKEELEAEMDFRAERLAKKVQRELEREFKGKFDQMEDVKENLWKEIKREVGLIGETDLNINPETGEISRWIDGIDFTKH